MMTWKSYIAFYTVEVTTDPPLLKTIDFTIIQFWSRFKIKGIHLKSDIIFSKYLKNDYIVQIYLYKLPIVLILLWKW